MTNSFKNFRLWIKLRQELSTRRRALRLISGSEGVLVSSDFGLEEAKFALRQLKLIYQEKAILFDNNGNSKIANVLIGLKETTADMEKIVLTWRQITNESEDNSP